MDGNKCSRYASRQGVFGVAYVIRRVTIEDYDDIYELWSSTEQTKRALNPVDDSREGIGRFLRRNPETCFLA